MSAEQEVINEALFPIVRNFYLSSLGLNPDFFGKTRERLIEARRTGTPFLVDINGRPIRVGFSRNEMRIRVVAEKERLNIFAGLSPYSQVSERDRNFDTGAYLAATACLLDPKDYQMVEKRGLVACLPVIKASFIALPSSRGLIPVYQEIVSPELFVEEQTALVLKVLA